MPTIFLAACQPQAILTLTPTVTDPPTKTTTPTGIPPTLTPSPSPSPSPTATLFPLPPAAAQAVYCTDRRPAADDLLAVVTATYGLAPGYLPPDLVRLGEYLPGTVTLPNMPLRRAAAEALWKMTRAMRGEGLSPLVLSGFRSYLEQVGTRQKWEMVDPALAAQVSALPGHSEHQLGTAVDFGSPGLAALTGDPSADFSPLFAQTAEGLWLAEHAHEYGFTLTNPIGAQQLTGLAYEPWHYRYVGVDLATYLHISGYFLTEYLALARPALPCIPDYGH